MTFSAFEPLEPRKLRAVDLSVASVDFPIGVLTPNEFTQVAVTVRNSGTNGQLTAFSGRVYLSANATLDGNDIQVGSFTIASLPSKTTTGHRPCNNRLRGARRRKSDQSESGSA